MKEIEQIIFNLILDKEKEVDWLPGSTPHQFFIDYHIEDNPFCSIYDFMKILNNMESKGYVKRLDYDFLLKWCQKFSNDTNLPFPPINKQPFYTYVTPNHTAWDLQNLSM